MVAVKRGYIRDGFSPHTTFVSVCPANSSAVASSLASISAASALQNGQ